jgi:hypothetical protein
LKFWWSTTRQPPPTTRPPNPQLHQRTPPFQLLPYPPPCDFPPVPPLHNLARSPHHLPPFLVPPPCFHPCTIHSTSHLRASLLPTGSLHLTTLYTLLLSTYQTPAPLSSFPATYTLQNHHAVYQPPPLPPLLQPPPTAPFGDIKLFFIFILFFFVI